VTPVELLYRTQLGLRLRKDLGRVGMRVGIDKASLAQVPSKISRNSPKPLHEDAQTAVTHYARMPAIAPGCMSTLQD